MIDQTSRSHSPSNPRHQEGLCVRLYNLLKVILYRSKYKLINIPVKDIQRSCKLCGILIGYEYIINKRGLCCDHFKMVILV